MYNKRLVLLRIYIYICVEIEVVGLTLHEALCVNVGPPSISDALYGMSYTTYKITLSNVLCRIFLFSVGQPKVALTTTLNMLIADRYETEAAPALGEVVFLMVAGILLCEEEITTFSF